MLNPKIFNETQKILSFHSQLDCFATRINTQLSEYFSRIPHPEAKFIDAFTINSNPYLCYLLPPFVMLPRPLQNIQVEQVEPLIVAPYWLTQPLFSQILNLAPQEPLVYKLTATNLILRQNLKAEHPLAEKSGKNIGN